MVVQNIPIGIDLGTTNSEIAINFDGKIEIIKNISQIEYTPSVFGFDRAKNPIVGLKAYQKLFVDPKEDDINNFKAEVKRIMGTSEKVFFPRVNRYFTPEEISSEILKSLKEDILRKYPHFPISSAVITTPASFDTVQAEATKRAGNLAGFEYVVLLQEPIAAAIAYGYGNAKNENILVYDLGGGTFDVALISSKEGNLSVLSHNGDNFLGGKDIDKLIVNEIIIPQILKKHKTPNLNEQNEKYRTLFAKLKNSAENAKIALTQYNKTNIEIVEEDEKGNDIILSFDIERSELENLIKPLIDKTIALSKKTIDDSGINSASVSKVILVGGPTQIPYIRNRIQKELGIAVDTSLDPLTVVANGACIFAISQQIPNEVRDKSISINPEARRVNLHFHSLSSENEESVAGEIPELKDVTEDYFIQIQSESGNYSSQKIKIKKGKFFESVALLPKRTNTFWLYLFDKEGNIQQLYPDTFTITQGLSVSGAPIPHSIGVALAKKDISNNFMMKEIFDPIFEKGSILPLKSEPRTYHTIKGLKKGDDNFLPIKIYEGESEIPDRNTFICDVKIKGSQLPYDLPEHTEVELTLTVDESRVVDVSVYIPIIDTSLSARGSMTSPEIDYNVLEGDIQQEIQRIQKIENDCTIEERRSVRQVLDTIEKTMKNAHHDEDEKRKADKQTKELKIILDKLEQEKEIPNLIREFHDHASSIQQMIVETYTDDSRKYYTDQLNLLKEEGEQAIKENDKFALIRINDQLIDLGRRIFFSNPGSWVYIFNQIVESKSGFSNPKEAQYYIEKGNRCIKNGDVDGLRECVIKLDQLLPPEEQKRIESVMSGITH